MNDQGIAHVQRGADVFRRAAERLTESGIDDAVVAAALGAAFVEFTQDRWGADYVARTFQTAAEEIARTLDDNGWSVN